MRIVSRLVSEISLEPGEPRVPSSPNGTTTEGANCGSGIQARRQGGVEHPARQDARHGEEEAHLEHRGRRAEDQRFWTTPATSSRATRAARRQPTKPTP